MILNRRDLFLLLMVVFFSISDIRAQTDQEKLASVDQSQLSVKVQSHEWQFEARLLKDKPIHYEPVWIELVLTNIGASTQYAPKLGFMFPYVNIEIFTEDGQPVPMAFIRAQLIIDSTWVPAVGPGEYVSTYTDLLRLLPPYRFVERQLPPRKYYIVASLYYDVWMKKDRDENTLILPPLYFEVVSPQGDAAEVLDIYKEALTSVSEDREQAVEKLKYIVENYPESPYKERALFKLYTIAPLASKSVEIANYWRKQYFLSCPDSPLNIHNFNTLRRRLPADEIRALYRSISDNPKAMITKQYIKRKYKEFVSEDSER